MKRAGLLAAVLASLALAAPATAGVGKFIHGVAAGEVTSKSAVLWAQTKKPGKVTAVFGARRAETFEEANGKAKASNDNTVQVEIGGLKPGTEHVYLFCARRGPCSEAGEFVTAPKARDRETIEFAYSGDAEATPLAGETKPYYGPFRVYRAMAREGNDFNVNLGDTMYSDTQIPQQPLPPALTVEEKWAKYAQNLDQRNLRTLRAETGVYSHWDDHEFINDFTIPEDGQALYDAGVQAFTDYMPVDYDPRNGLYRTVRWGRNLELFFLDMRSFRSAKASAGGVCDNPQTGGPDFVPTLPESKRQLFSAVAPSLAEPVPQACKDAINDPTRTMLGQRQFDRFIRDVDASPARFKVIVNETPMQQLYVLPYDQWEGYAFERLRLLNRLEELNVENLVFLTTDTHAAYANVVRKRTFEGDVAPSNAPPAPQDTQYQDFIIGPVATNTWWQEIDLSTSPGTGELVGQAFDRPPPPDGLGISCTRGDIYSYGQVRVTGSRLTVTYLDENGDPVIGLDGQPCGPYVIQAQ